MTPQFETLETKQTGSVLWLNLNRPQARNAMNRQMVLDLLACFESLKDNRAIRVAVLGATGPTFCAGGDIKELQAEISAGREAQIAQAELFDRMLKTVSEAGQVVIAKVQGPAMGGGVALLCAADIAIAADNAPIGLPEVRLGLIPAVISPYVLAKIGLNKAKELFLTGARLKGQQALSAGLINQTCPPESLDQSVNAVVNEVLQAGPSALSACKALLREVSGKALAETLAYRVDTLNQLRQSAEGQEGMMAFIQKRPPNWVETI